MKLISHDNSLECHKPRNDDDRRMCMFVRNKQLTSTITWKGIPNTNTYKKNLCMVSLFWQIHHTVVCYDWWCLMLSQTLNDRCICDIDLVLTSIWNGNSWSSSMRTLHDICLLVLAFVIVELIEYSYLLSLLSLCLLLLLWLLLIRIKVSLAFSFVYWQLLIMLKSVFIVDG